MMMKIMVKKEETFVSDESSNAECEIKMNDIESFDKAVRPTKSKWKLPEGKLVENVLPD